jgi:hypothetical protein
MIWQWPLLLRCFSGHLSSLVLLSAHELTAVVPCCISTGPAMLPTPDPLQSTALSALDGLDATRELIDLIAECDHAPARRAAMIAVDLLADVKAEVERVADLARKAAA